MKYSMVLLAAMLAALPGYGDSPSEVNKPATDRNFWYELNLLYWQPWEKSAVVTNHYAPVLTTDNYTTKHLIHPNFKWDWGFRIGVGYYFVPPKWSLDLQWTNFSTNDSQTRSSNTDDSVNINQLGSFPIWDIPSTSFSGDYVSNSHLHWKLSLNLLDLNFTRIFQKDRWCFKPYVGLRSGWVRQKFDVEYSGGIFTLTFISPGNDNNGIKTIEMRNEYWGLGPRVGFAPSVLLGKGISIYAESAISALMGCFHLDQHGEYLGTSEFHYHSNPFGLRWILDVAAGFMYCTAIFSDRYDLSLKLGYEFHEFYHQMELRRDRFNVAPHNSNLSLQGVTANVRMDF